MEYVKGCDIIGLSKYSLKKITEGRIEIAEGLRDVLSLEILSGLFEESKTDFTDGNGKTIKGLPSGEIFVMTKKIDKKKYIIGVSCIKRIAGEPSGKKGIDSWFEGSRDKMIEDKRFFADGFEKEMAYFDHSMIDHFRNSVGFDQIGEAEYQDKIITKASGKKVLGIYFSSTALFINLHYHDHNLGPDLQKFCNWPLLRTLLRRQLHNGYQQSKVQRKGSGKSTD